MAPGNIVLVSMYDSDSLALHTLHAVLKRAGYPVKSIFFKRHRTNQSIAPEPPEEIEAFIGLLKELKPIMVGLSVRSMNYQLAVQLSDHIRRNLETFLIWGGIHVTVSPETCLDHADAICIGEGEEAIVELARNLTEGRPVEDIRNLWFKRGGQIIRNDLRTLISDLDALPFPDYLNDDKFLIDDGGIAALPTPESRVTYWMMTSRGCPYSCTYCCNNTLHETFRGKGPYIRRRSVASVIEELRQVKAHFKNVQHISFWDDVFTMDVKWLREFQPRFKSELGFSFFCFIHSKTITEEVARLLKASGPCTMTMGVQSGSEEFRRKYYKRFETNEDVIRASHILYNHGIPCSYDLLADNPLETDADRHQTLELLLRMPRPVDVHPHTLTHFPATELTRTLLERGLIKREDVEDIKRKSLHRWVNMLDVERDRGNLFWDNLFYMTSRSFSEHTIRGFSNSRLHKRWPIVVTWALRLTSDHELTRLGDSRLDRLRIRLVHRLRPAYHWLKDLTRPVRHALRPRRGQ